MTWDRKILRKIYGLPCGTGSWRIELNQEICNKFKSPDITVVKARRFEWLGHAVRLDGEMAVNRLLNGKPCGGREKRKTQFKVDGLCRDGFDEYGRERRRRALDRAEGASVVREPSLNLKRCSAK